MNRCIIAIGSNIDARSNIRLMLDLLAKKVRVVRVSSFEQTAPIGILDQPHYTNGAVLVETNLDAGQLKKILMDIENHLGRDRSLPKFGPRTIDLDILIWNNKVADPDYHTRNFLRTAAAELGFENKELQ